MHQLSKASKTILYIFEEDFIMEKALLDFVIAKTQDLLAAPSACQEVKAAATAWLAAVGTEKEKEETG